MKNKIMKKTAGIFMSFCMVLSTLTIGPFGTITAMADTTTAPDPSTITVDNYIEGISDKVEVTGLAAGDIVKVYNAESGGSPIGTATAGTTQAATVMITQLGKEAGSVYVSLTGSGKDESARTQKTYSSEPIPWQIYDHTGNWGEDANIPKTGLGSAKYPSYPVDGNGNSDDNPLGIQYNQHIIVKNNGSRVTFYGYGEPAYVDFIFLPSDGVAHVSDYKQTFTFNLDLSKVNYHSMEGAGFLIGSKIESGKLSGYAILFTGAENQTQKYIQLYKLDNVDVNTLHAGPFTGCSGVSTVGSQITPAAGDIHTISLTVSPTSVTMDDNGSKVIDNQEISAYGNGLGLIAGYKGHSCSALSYFTITNVQISDSDNSPYPWPVLDLSGQPDNKAVNLTYTTPTEADVVVLQQSTNGIDYVTAQTAEPITTTAANIKVTGLTNDQKYYFRLLVGAGGNAGISNIATVTPKAMIGDLAAVGKNQKADLTFTAPEGATSVTLKYSTDGSTYSNASTTDLITESSTTASAINLTNGQKYFFKLVISGGTYAGDSNVAFATPVAASVPDAPTAVTAAAGDASVALTWTAPANDGGSAIIDYKIDVFEGETKLKTQDTNSTNTSAIVLGLTNGTAYTFKIIAANDVGDGTPSSLTSVVVPRAPHESRDSSGVVTPSAPAPSGPKIVANVVDGSGSRTVSTVNAQVTTNADGTDTVKFKPAETVVIKQHDGSSCAFGDYSKIGFEAPQSAPVAVNSDGTVQVKNLAKSGSYDMPVTYDLGSGQKITIGKMHIAVDKDGNVSMTSDLIDPYGTMTDSMTGKPLTGANIVLYYADTARNKAAGKTPGTQVQLPGIDGFKPNNNKNPQTTDNDGAYGYMVYPNTDYYITVTKDGYDTFTSPTIPVATELVKFSARLNQPITGVKRVAGNTRVDTAIQLAKSEFAGKVNSVIFATADNYPDALTGSVLAHNQSAPILLVGDSQEDKDKVLSYMKDYLASNGKVFLLGGTGVVTEDFANQVKNTGYSNITRLGGVDRYETAAKIKEYLSADGASPVIIASGEDYPDALAVSSAAAVNQYPILLVTKNTVSDSVKSELSKLKPSKIYVVGGQGAVSDEVKDQAAKLTSLDSNNVIRLGGADRYSTSVNIAKNFNLSGKSACVSTGDNFPDALAGSVYAANYNAPIILVGNALTDEQKAYIQSLKLSGATIFGGEGAVKAEVQDEVTGLISK